MCIGLVLELMNGHEQHDWEKTDAKSHTRQLSSSLPVDMFSSESEPEADHGDEE